MLVVPRFAGTALSTATFADLPRFLAKGDILVLNNTKVVPARLHGRVGERENELLLLEYNSERARAIGRPMRHLRKGVVLSLANGIEAHVTGAEGDVLDVRFQREGILLAPEVALDSVGEMPIPPYIREGRGDEADREDYQTIFAQRPGSVAAPTASLHFSDALCDALRSIGVELLQVTLHLSAASFQPVIKNDGTLRPPGREQLVFSEASWQRITEARSGGRRVIAVGTSVVRALESVARMPALPTDGAVVPTELFVQPGMEILAIDGLITNFHQPGTTHLLLVETFLGRGRLEQAYEYALREDFRFLSYGDGMLIL